MSQPRSFIFGNENGERSNIPFFLMPSKLEEVSLLDLGVSSIESDLEVPGD